MTDKYTYRIEWNDEDGAYIGRCLEFPLLSSQEKTPENALKEIRIVVEASAKWMEEEGAELPEPLGTQKYKGRIVLRVPPEIHKELVVESKEAGVSLNQFLLSKVSRSEEKPVSSASPKRTKTAKSGR